MAFLFRENRKYGTNGQTDGRGATLNAAFYMESRIIIRSKLWRLHYFIYLV